MPNLRPTRARVQPGPPSVGPKGSPVTIVPSVEGQGPPLRHIFGSTHRPTSGIRPSPPRSRIRSVFFFPTIPTQTQQLRPHPTLKARQPYHKAMAISVISTLFYDSAIGPSSFRMPKRSSAGQPRAGFVENFARPPSPCRRQNGPGPRPKCDSYGPSLSHFKPAKGACPQTNKGRFPCLGPPSKVKPAPGKNDF